MKELFLPLFGAAALLAAATTHSAANDRYTERPPVVVSPDLSAPWVLQLGGQPDVAWQNRQRQQQRPRFGQAMPQPQALPDRTRTAAVVRPTDKRVVMRRQIDPIYLPQEVAYDGPQKPGTVIVDTPNRFLFLVQPGGRALRYGIGVGRPGFSWAGTKTVTRKAEWPSWTPPAEMLKRRPDLPRFMAGGPENPLGARALYLGSTLYRIHGTNEPNTIGREVSSGCIRMTNDDVIDLYGRVGVGAKVVVI